MKEQPQHLYKEAEHAAIHDPTADETVLARWLRRGLEKGPAFWLLVIGVVGAIAVLLSLLNAMAGGESATSRAWIEAIAPPQLASGAGEGFEGVPAEVRPLLAVADAHPETEAGRWARYRVAAGLYQEGLRNLPNNREAAGPILRQAHDEFVRVVEAAPKDDPVRGLAMMGVARALESRGELDEAIASYRAVAEAYPDSAFATVASDRVKTLDTADARAFYEKFYTANFATAVEGPGMLPGGLGSDPFGSGLFGSDPFGSGSGLGLPGSTSPGLGLPPAIPEGFGLPPIPPAPSGDPGTGLPGLPPEIVPPESTPADAPATPESPVPPSSTVPETPTAPGSDAPAGAELPGNLFPTGDIPGV